jgi:carboxymethylenebutenolidase
MANMRTRVLFGASALIITLAAAVAAGSKDPAATAGTRVGWQEPSLPASGTEANQRLAASPRKGEWVMVRTGTDSVRAWVVYPAQRQNAPVVVAVHDNQGMSNWIRAVADQLAADGFIAIAPDLLSMLDVARHPDGESVREAVSAALRNVDQATRDRFIQAVGEWGTKLDGASSKYGIVGFCWGGSTVFAHAVAAPATLGAVVVYYGGAPAPDRLASVRAPILGLYAGDDARVNTTVIPADSALKALGRVYETHFFEGAGHGFTRSQEQREGANREAVKKAWPLTVAWFRQHLGA